MNEASPHIYDWNLVDGCACGVSTDRSLAHSALSEALQEAGCAVVGQLRECVLDVRGDYVEVRVIAHAVRNDGGFVAWYEGPQS
jgi:hypothetical protein